MVLGNTTANIQRILEYSVDQIKVNIQYVKSTRIALANLAGSTVIATTSEMVTTENLETLSSLKILGITLSGAVTVLIIILVIVVVVICYRRQRKSKPHMINVPADMR